MAQLQYIGNRWELRITHRYSTADMAGVKVYFLSRQRVASSDVDQTFSFK